MITEPTRMDLLDRGMDCLMNSLGLVDAERFLSLVSAEKFDYTEWRRQHLNFDGKTIKDLSAEAMSHRKNS